jgi:hypothetical protein
VLRVFGNAACALRIAARDRLTTHSDTRNAKMRTRSIKVKAVAGPRPPCRAAITRRSTTIRNRWSATECSERASLADIMQGLLLASIASAGFRQPVRACLAIN